MNLKYKARLDDVAEAFRKMVDEKGRPIPVIFRPLHEHTQTWNWWGRSATTDREFIAFWRFIVSYLRDTKDVHNVIYAISPQMDAVYDDPVERGLERTHDRRDTTQYAVEKTDGHRYTLSRTTA